MPEQKTHNYHPIHDVTAKWAAIVSAMDDVATKTVEERAAIKRQREAATLRHEASFPKPKGT